MGKLGLAVWAALTVACSSQEELPCASSGDGWLDLPQSRVAAVKVVRTDGVCDAITPKGPCSGECFVTKDGEERRMILVRGRTPGRCTVTVVFADDCGEQSLAYEFGEPRDNCCADACFQRGNASYAIDACTSAP